MNELTTTVAALSFLVVSILLVTGPTATGAADHDSAVSAPAASAREAVAAQLRKDARGRVRRNKIYYRNDRVSVAEPAGTNSLSQCDAGEFCIWSYTGYTGSFIYETGQAVTRTIQTNVGSFYNGAMIRTWCATNGGGAMCGSSLLMSVLCS